LPMAKWRSCASWRFRRDVHELDWVRPDALVAGRDSAVAMLRGLSAPRSGSVADAAFLIVGSGAGILLALGSSCIRYYCCHRRGDLKACRG
jgi:hypothetical protein